MKGKNRVLKAVAVLVMAFFLGTVVMTPVAEANIKHLLLGAGLGVVGGAIFGPMIVGGLGAAGGLIGGAITAVGGALAGVAGAVGTGILAVAASPFFIPAVCLGAGLLVGKLIWDHSKNNTSVKSETDRTSVAGGGVISKVGGTISATVGGLKDKVTGLFSKAKAKVTGAAPNTGRSGSGVYYDSTLVASATNAAPSDNTIANDPNRGVSRVSAVKPGGDAAMSAEGDVKSQYEAAYKRYVELLQAGKGMTDPEVQDALANYKALYKQYQDMVQAAK